MNSKNKHNAQNNHYAFQKQAWLLKKIINAFSF